MNTHRFKSLEEALSSVPRELQPGHDLWPAIASRLAEPRGPAGDLLPSERPTAWPMALAASLGVLALAGALCWSVIQRHGTTQLTAQRNAVAAPANRLVSFEAPRDADYVAARKALETTFRDRLALLAPATRSRIEADLATIRKANEDIRAALAQDPASPLLWQLLRSTSQQELNLYANVARTTEPILKRRI